ncbi:MAG: hypothetical protein OEU36_16125 [Gammaproteobacteria bacterium]|nr:hypothetical protein [Gammaproteobacteria bacterium]
MSNTLLFACGLFVFTMLLIGVVLTVYEFRTHIVIDKHANDTENHAKTAGLTRVLELDR